MEFQGLNSLKTEYIIIAVNEISTNLLLIFQQFTNSFIGTNLERSS